MTKLTKLPAYPQRSVPATFSSLADAYLAALANYQGELNVIAADVVQAATYVTTYLANHALYQSTSTSSYTFGSATATLVTQASEAYVTGSRVIAYNGTSYIIGDVTSYSGTSLVMKVLLSNGTGSLASWSIATIYGPAAGGVVPVVASAATVDLSGLGGQVVQITGNTPTTALTLPTGAPVYAIAPNGWKLTYNSSSLVLEGLQDYTCTVGDRLTFLKSSGGSINVLITRVSGVPVSAKNTRGIFGYGWSGPSYSLTNLVSARGVVSLDVTGVGTARSNIAAGTFGGDKCIFGYGYAGGHLGMTNVVNNTGTVSADIGSIGTVRSSLAAAGYGFDRAIFAYGSNGTNVSMSNLVSNQGVVATDVTGVGTIRSGLAAAGYGLDKAIFGYGTNAGYLSLTNLASNTGVITADVTGVGTARSSLAAVTYGVDKSLFGYGADAGNQSVTNLVSNVGVVSTDTTGVGSARYSLAATVYGSDKAVFGYGNTGSFTSLTNYVSNLGVVSADVTGVGTARSGLAASSYS